MKFAIIGASGQLGQEFFKLSGPHQFLGLTHHEVDVETPGPLRERLASLRPDVVVNLAAFHKVDECELRPERAFAVNTLGALHAAQAAAAVGAAIVFFSTDYVFGGDRGRCTPYRESDPPAPVSLYGASKLAGEHAVRLAAERHFIIRTCGLYGVVTSHKGWTFPEMILQKARAGEKIRVVDDQFLTPTYTYDLVRAVVAVVEKGRPGLYHLTSSGQCSWYEFARAALELAGIPADLQPVSTAEFGARAHRPAYSVLAGERLAGLGVDPLRPWPQALRAYLQEKGVIG